MTDMVPEKSTNESKSNGMFAGISSFLKGLMGGKKPAAPPASSASPMSNPSSPTVEMPAATTQAPSSVTPEQPSVAPTSSDPTQTPPAAPTPQI